MRLSALGANDTRSFGVSLWEWWNPEQVQAEYIAVGKVPPSVEQIRADAVYSAAIATGETAASVVESFQAAGGALKDTALDFGKLALVLGAVVLYLFLTRRK